MRSKQCLRNSEVSEFTRINAAPARRGSRRRRHGIAAQSPRKEKEPDKIGFVFFSCGGESAKMVEPELKEEECFARFICFSSCKICSLLTFSRSGLSVKL